MEKTLYKDFGVIVSPPGSGKTIIGLELITRKRQPALIIVHRKRTKIEVNIRETNLFAPFDYKIDKYETISRILIHDTNRNSLILDDIDKNSDRFKTFLILTERKAHVDILNLYPKDKYDTIPMVVQDDILFYELLAILDTLRIGRVREIKIAIDELEKRLKNA